MESEQQALKPFIKAMISKMELRRDRYKPFGWRDPEYKTLRDLSEHLESEVMEWQDTETVEDEMAELVDVANSAFMLHDRLRLEVNMSTQKDIIDALDKKYCPCHCHSDETGVTFNKLTHRCCGNEMFKKIML